MKLLSRLQLRAKLALLLGLSAIAVVCSIVVAASLMHQRMQDDRVDKLRAVVHTALGLAQSLENQVAAHRLTREQALSQFGDAAHTIRFDGGLGYLIVLNLDTKDMVFHGAVPKLENKPATAKVADGRLLSEVMRDALIGTNETFIAYLFTQSGEPRPVPKVAYVARFAPWKLVFLAGANTDDLDMAFRVTLLKLAMTAGVILAATLLAAWLINRDVCMSLGKLRGAIEQLAQGDLTTAIPGTERRDEVAHIARAVLGFKDHMLALSAEREAEYEHSEVAKRAALRAMAERIEAETGAALEEVARRADAMATTANEMNESASRTDNSAQQAAAAAGEALSNAQAVASAAEELASSIREIGGQVSQSTAVVARAVQAGAETRQTIEALNEQMGRIGAVADMIGAIAAKTNLLALNATIEAARAGDAGKGFAVVASEVKALATQTAQSTQEITRHIGEVRAATGASVAAVDRIEQTIGEVNEIAGSIAAAVEEQGAATAEIARNITQTAHAAEAMTGRVAEVSTEATQTGRSATAARDHTVGLKNAVQEFKHGVIRVVRTSTDAVNRRHMVRYKTALTCRVSVPGQSVQTAQVTDMSEGGACVMGGPRLSPDARGVLDVDGVGFPLPFTVRGAEDGTLHLAFVLDSPTAMKFRSIPERLSHRLAA